MRYTKTLQKAINEHGLQLIHTGKLGYKGSRYLNSDCALSGRKKARMASMCLSLTILTK